MPTDKLCEHTVRQAACDAYVYGAPLLEMARMRHLYASGGRSLNQLHHRPGLVDHRARVVTTPNVDTLYSSTWIDTRNGPAVLHLPPAGERYVSVAILDMYSNNVAVLSGARLAQAGTRLRIEGPGASPPARGEDVVQLPTSCGWMIVRILVADAHDDLPAAQAVQQGFALEAPAVPAPLPARGALNPDISLFAELVGLLEENPPPQPDGFIQTAMSRVLQALQDSAWTTALQQGLAQARSLVEAPDPGAFVQGWDYPLACLGDFGEDYLYRARIARSALAALPVAEAMYMRARGDGAPGFFEGPGPFRLHLPAHLPVDGFWSLTLYEATPQGLFLVDNPLGRYLVNDRMPGLVREADGSLVIWIARSAPDAHLAANWLPAPPHGAFALYMRCYLPQPSLLDGQWRLPPVEAV
ncbi:DUF1254 domain-containing protein [Comamonas composti]|uniref:DUF1254 domain-containing protein n=1 Tax=Comamonas composti TaxID=408558 RepID=UPI00040A1E51|nr:DUF1254 domain-containing protein [Comamonas composti]